MIKEEKGDVNKNFPFIIEENSFSLLFKTDNFRKILDLLRRKGIFLSFTHRCEPAAAGVAFNLSVIARLPFGKPWQSNLRKKRLLRRFAPRNDN